MARVAKKPFPKTVCSSPCNDYCIFPHPILSPKVFGQSIIMSSSREALKIGIIGFGPFAQFLARTILKQGHTLTATSRSDHSELCFRLGINFFRDIHTFLEVGNDVILLCTSIVSLSDVLKSIPFHLVKNPKTLFAEVLSVKNYPRDLLLQVMPETMDLLCTHPMFGPESGKDGWDGLPFVFERVRIRDQDVCSRFLQIFEQEGCRMVEMTCEEHDKQAARSQFLTHTIGRILSEMDIKSTSMDTKGFQNLVQLKESTMKDGFDLYSGLFIHNKFAQQELENLELAIQTVKQQLLDQMQEK